MSIVANMQVCSQQQWAKMNKKLEDLLIQLRIFDPDRTLSLTSILMMVLITKIALVPVLDMASLGVILLTLVNYNLKKFNHYKTRKTDDGVKQKVERLETEVRSLINAAELSKLRR